MSGKEPFKLKMYVIRTPRWTDFRVAETMLSKAALKWLRGTRVATRVISSVFRFNKWSLMNLKTVYLHFGQLEIARGKFLS